MMNTLAIFAACLCLLSGIPESSSAVCQRRVCYQKNDRLLGTSKLVPEDIDPGLCTHLIFNFARLENNYHFKPFTSKEIEVISKFNYKKNQNNDLKTMLAVEGYILPYTPFMKMVSNATNRKTFIDNAIPFLRKYNFDGLDILWSYPPSSPEKEKHKLTLLLQELNLAFRKEFSESGGRKSRLHLSTYLPQDTDESFEAYLMSEYVDMINVFAFNLQRNSKTGNTGHTSPLYYQEGGSPSYKGRSVDSLITSYVILGVHKDKINIGLTTEGRSFTLTDKNKNGVGDRYRKLGWSRNYTKTGGHVSYQEVCEMKKEGATVRRIDDQKVPYLVKGNQWVGYEDPESIREKVNYINDEGYGGFWIWMLDYDDFSGSFCNEGTFPLANAAKEKCNENTPVNANKCHPDGPFSFPSDTKRRFFFMCENGMVSLVNCPEGKHYSERLEKCL